LHCLFDCCWKHTADHKKSVVCNSVNLLSYLQLVDRFRVLSQCGGDFSQQSTLFT
jgi:hypothetical protein